MTDKLDTIDEYTACMQTIAKDIRTTLTPDASKTTEMWVNTNMNPDWMDLAAVSAFITAGHLMQQYLNAYQARQAEMALERVRCVEARIEELTGEVTR